jgi:hypothetical protein
MTTCPFRASCRFGLHGDVKLKGFEVVMTRACTKHEFYDVNGVDHDEGAGHDDEEGKESSHDEVIRIPLDVLRNCDC